MRKKEFRDWEKTREVGKIKGGRKEPREGQGGKGVNEGVQVEE
jgi:hypothetical protein